jgi:hypothetical protein
MRPATHDERSLSTAELATLPPHPCLSKGPAPVTLEAYRPGGARAAYANRPVARQAQPLYGMEY